MKNLNESLENLYWKELAEEGITKDDIELIDLDIAFEPVTPIKGASPCEVIETIGGKYLVNHPLSADAVTEEELKVMRFRYLQFDPDRIRQRNSINRMFGG